MSEKWDSYFCNVNDKLASIPDKRKQDKWKCPKREETHLP
jgi:hypothetical protein